MVRRLAIAICAILMIGGAALGAETFRDLQKYGDCLVNRGVVIARKLGVPAERASVLAGTQCKFVGNWRDDEGGFDDGVIHAIEQRLAQGAAPPPNNLTDAQRRKIVLPAIKLSTDCIAAEAAKDPDILSIIRSGTLSQRTRLYADRCLVQLGAMTEIYDRLYGSGKGEEFVDGPYWSDLPRAVAERIQSGRFTPSTPSVPAPPPASPAATTEPAPAPAPEPPRLNAIGSGRDSDPPKLPNELMAPDFGMKDLPIIHKTYGDNQARFVRDYRNKTFGANMPVLGIREAFLERGEFHVSLGEKSNIDVTCNSLTPESKTIIYSINKGDNVYVKGRIDDHTFGILILQECSISKNASNNTPSDFNQRIQGVWARDRKACQLYSSGKLDNPSIDLHTLRGFEIVEFRDGSFDLKYQAAKCKVTNSMYINDNEYNFAADCEVKGQRGVESGTASFKYDDRLLMAFSQGLLLNFDLTKCSQ